MDISIQGNEFLSEQDFDRAIECYTTAIDIEEDEGVLICCYSNRANAYYEKGLYTDCIADAKACLKICDDPKLVKKNMLRLARAAMCVNQFETAVSTLKELIRSCQQNNRDPYLKRTKKLLFQLQFYSSKRPSFQNITKRNLEVKFPMNVLATRLFNVHIAR